MLCRVSAGELTEWAVYYGLEEEDRKNAEAEERR
jgi:hypothetical protein